MQQLFSHQHQVLELVSRAAPLEETLLAVVVALEDLLEGARCTVLLLDRATDTLHHGAAPSVPPAYRSAIEGMRVGPQAGCCGTAVHLGSTVVTPDIATDPCWDEFREAALAAGLRSCWSRPVRGHDGDVVGTFAVYHATPHTPDDHERELVARYADLAGVAIQHDQLVRELVTRQVAQREAEVARETAERHSRAKSEFLVAVGQELRTPLQAITGFAELLGSLDLDQARRDEALRRIRRAATDVLDLLEDVLDISRVEADVLEVARERVPVRDVVAEVAALVAEQARQRRVDVRDETGATTVLADRQRVRQVLVNVLTNAVHHGRVGGRVTVTAVTVGDAVRIDVVDDGPGIPEQFPPPPFLPFERWDAGSGRGDDVQGFGLGLVVSHGLASAMGGGLTVFGVPGNGTVTRLTLPAAPAEPTA